MSAAAVLLAHHALARLSAFGEMQMCGNGMRDGKARSHAGMTAVGPAVNGRVRWRAEKLVEWCEDARFNPPLLSETRTEGGISDASDMPAVGTRRVRVVRRSRPTPCRQPEHRREKRGAQRPPALL
jgi:hypothetical protein